MQQHQRPPFRPFYNQYDNQNQYRGNNFQPNYQNYNNQQFVRKGGNYQERRQNSSTYQAIPKGGNQSVQGQDLQNPQTQKEAKIKKAASKQVSSSGTLAAQKQKQHDPAAVDPDKLQCFKCWNKGHATKECSEEVLCVNCDKTSHISNKYTWLKQRKPMATMVGFGAEGLGFFVTEHAKQTPLDDKKSGSALVKIKEGLDFNVTAEILILNLSKTYPWKWDWKAKELKPSVFKVEFPSADKVNGKLSVVWMQAKRVPKELKNFHGLYEVGSTIGFVIEVDMETFWKNGQVHMKIGIADVGKIPKVTTVTGSNLLIYHVWIKVIEVVELGWMKNAKDNLLDFDAIEDEDISEMEDKRDPKRLKGTDAGNSTPEPDVLQQGQVRDSVMRHANDIMLDGEDKFHDGKAQLSDDEEEAGKVQLSDDEAEVEDVQSTQESLGTKMDRIIPGFRNKEDREGTDGGINNRFSGRLAGKYSDDVPILDRAKNLKSKNLTTDEAWVLP
ncbi:hypothetical protein ACQ4PT_065918 [Festuca glaucescens]